MSDNDEAGTLDFGDDVEIATFEQILEMDDGEEDDAREFSRSIVFGFFEQAENTFENMNTAMEQEDLAELSALGHFLKGSAATLGFTKVKDECEKIQNLGNQKDETGNIPEPDKAKNLRLIKDCIKRARDHYRIVEVKLKRFYESMP